MKETVDPETVHRLKSREGDTWKIRLDAIVSAAPVETK
jgi:hypothetical protein